MQSTFKNAKHRQNCGISEKNYEISIKFELVIISNIF